MRGLAHYLPLLSTMLVFAGLAGLGLPALAGFVSEVTVFLGAFGRHEPQTAVALVGVLLAAGYVLWALQRSVFGPRDERWRELQDVRAWWEFLPLGALVSLIVLLGVYPSVVLDVFELGVRPIAEGIAVFQPDIVESEALEVARLGRGG